MRTRRCADQQIYPNRHIATGFIHSRLCIFETLMAKKGIKIKELARELAVTSRELIDRCRVEGLTIQNSITKLDTDTERRVRAWFEELHSDTGCV